MTKKKKLLIMAAGVAGAILVLAQAVWADGDGAKKTEPTQVSAAEHAAHHPESQTASAAVENKDAPAAQADMMKMMGSGNMDEMMKMMQKPEGKQMMEKCLELQNRQPSAAAEG